MITHSAFENYFLLLPLIGFIVGLVGTMIGGGGGFIFIPVLTLLFGLPAQVAVATSLAAPLPICIVGSIAHYRHNHIEVPIGLVMAAAGVGGAFGGAKLTSMITHQQLIICYGTYAILIALLMIRSQRKRKKEQASGIEKPEGSRIAGLARGTFFGFLAGTITATFGTSGATPIQAGLFAMRKPVKVVIGTALMVVTANTASALGAHLLVGQIDLTYVYFLTAGTIVGSIFGPKIVKNVKLERVDGPIRMWYAAGLIIFGTFMILSVFEKISLNP